MRSSVVRFFLTFVVLLPCPPAFGQTMESTELGQFVVSDSQCPTTAEVIRETLRLTPNAQPNVDASNIRVTLEDLGDRYHLRIDAPFRQAEKTYVDPSRDCSRRARFAAVLFVLTLMPPEVEADVESPPVESPAKAPQTPPPKVRSDPSSNAEPIRRWFHLDLGAAARGSPPLFESPTLLSPGVLLQGTVGPGRFRGYLEMGYFPEETLELKGISAQLRRTPVALGLSLNRAFRVFSFAVDFGAIIEITRVQGTGLVSPKTRSTFEGGAQLGGHVTLGQGWLLPTWSIKLNVFPSPSRLEMAPRGHLGKLPTLELMTYLGGRIGF